MSRKPAEVKSKYGDKLFGSKLKSAKISQINFSYENYVVEGIEGSLTVLKKNDMADSLAKSSSNSEFSKTHSKSKADTKSTKEMFSKTTNNMPSKKEIDQKRLNAFQNRFLLYTYIGSDQDIDIQNMPAEIKMYNDSRHAALAKFIGYNLYDSNQKENPCILTERPINGPLCLFFDSNNQFNSSMTSDSEIDLSINNSDGFSVINGCFNNWSFSLTPKNKFIIIIGIIAGIEFIHRLGKVHGHLNPTNVYLDDKFFPKISGYGFIKPNQIIHDLDNQPNYAFIAPEVSCEGPICQKSDVYSIGMMIYYILSEMEPFQNDRPQVQLYNSCEGIMPSFPEYISDEWKKIIVRCWEKNPKSRLSASELLSYLLKKDNIHMFVSSIHDFNQESDSNETDEFTKDQNEYIDYIINNFKFDSDFQDCYIMREMVPDPTALSEEVKSLIGKASNNDPESLVAVGHLFLEGKRKLPRVEENAFELFQKSADLGDREGMKMVAKLCRDGIGTQKNLKKALIYNEKALKLFKGNKVEEKILNDRINEIEEEIKNPNKEEEMPNDELKLVDFDDDDEANKLRKKDIDTNRECYITVHNITNATTKADIEQAFRKVKNINVQLHSTALYDSATVFFQNTEDKKKFSQIYKSRKTKIKIRGKEVEIKDLPLSKKELKKVQEKKRIKRQKGMMIGATTTKTKSTKREQPFNEDEDENQAVYEINFNDYYPGKDNKEYEKVGNGSFANAYKAYRKSDNEVFIAKVFKNSFKSKTDRKNFVRETKALIDIDHPLIIKLFGYSLYSLIKPSTKFATMIMEYMPNNTLLDVIMQEHDKNRPDWWDNTAKIKALIGISKGMAYVHGKGYIHRDLKPANIFFDKNYEIKIGDFGCSRKFDKNNEVVMTFNIGTPIYSAPEIFDEDNIHYSWEVDVYSFAIILYQIVTAKAVNELYPNKRTIYSLYRCIRSGIRPIIPEGVNQYLVEIMNKCWSSAIDDRPSFQFIYDVFKKIFKSDKPPTTFLPNVDVNEIRKYLDKLDSFDL